MEAKEALAVTDQQVPGVEENIPWPEDILQQLPLGQLWPPSVAQEWRLLAHRGHQQPWLTWQSHRGQGWLPTRGLLPPTSKSSTNLEMWPHSAPGCPGSVPLW